MNNWIIDKDNPTSLYSCSLMASIVLRHGSKGLTQDRFNQEWNYNDYPMSVDYLRRTITNRKIKWYIHNYVAVEDDIWNSDFIHGLSQYGRIRWLKQRFPSLIWEANDNIYNMLEDCPLHGKLFKDHINYRWVNSPALCLKYNEDSPSFMAGVLATGKIYKYRGHNYIRYSGKVMHYLKKWNIPIEHETKIKLFTLISPFWPALFSKYMPKASSVFFNIKKAYKANLYAGILYRVYVSNEFKPNAIPYLNSRRWVYNNLGTVEETELKWLHMGLSQLNKNITKTVQIF